LKNVRYEIKWLGVNIKNDSESSEKSKTFVGIRAETDHANKIITQDQTQLIRKAAVRFGWRRRASKAFFAGAQRSVSEAGSGCNSRS
jgi:hypothetical protein